MDVSDDENAWKIFQRDTEAGRLLSRLYGVPPSSHRINYPKLRQRTGSGANNSNDDTINSASRGWKTTYCVHGWRKDEAEKHENERKVHRARALSLAVPKVGRPSGIQCIQGYNNSIAKVDLIPKRKNETQCKDTLSDYNFANKKYRPPRGHATSSDAEKQRLNDIFDKNGGRCLPEDLTTAPALKADSSARVSVNGKPKAPRPNNTLTLFDQIYNEILERREHQLAMEEMGAGEAMRESTANEIKIRLQQLRKLDPKRAVEVVQKLMKS